MRDLTRILGTLAVAAALVAVAGAARADSRLFGARTDQPGVTIIQAFRNGQPLPVAGQGGGATFFRIDNPAGAVPCTHRILFSASNGQSFDLTPDLCAQNWDVTIALRGGGGSVGGSGNQSVTIATDDPDITVTEVFLRGQPVSIAGRSADAVAIEVARGPVGIECRRDLGLALSDGRRIARDVDICRNNWVVVIELIGASAPPPIVRPLPPSPPPPPPPPPPVRPLPPSPPPQLPPLPLPGRPDLVDNMNWLASTGANGARLAYGLPNTDAGELTAVCQPRSSTVTITFDRTAPEVRPGSPVFVRLAAGGFSKTYTAFGTQIMALSGQSHPRIDVTTSDPLWPALIGESLLTVAIGSGRPYALSLRGSGAAARQFLAICNPPPVVTIPEVGGFAYQCDNGVFVRATFDHVGNSALVAELGAPPMVLYQVPDLSGDRYVAGWSDLVHYEDRITWSRNGAYQTTCYPR